MRRGERSIRSLPKPLLLSFIFILFIQVGMHRLNQSLDSIEYKPLSAPLEISLYYRLSMGSQHLFSYLLAIGLQLHDNQAGRHLLYDNINYSILVDWLSLINRLNPESEYAMLLASGVYSNTKNKHQLKILLDFIDKHFTANPQLHWRRQAEATVIAKHQLGDLNIALQMAQRLSSQPEQIIMPRWARDMHFLLLADLNEYESAIVIIQRLMQSEAITDSDEQRFLQEKLSQFQQKLSEIKQNP